MYVRQAHYYVVRCVRPSSGLPISGTSKLKERPNCDNVPDNQPDDVVPLRPSNSNRNKADKSGGKKSGKNRKKRRGRSPPPTLLMSFVINYKTV